MRMLLTVQEVIDEYKLAGVPRIKDINGQTIPDNEKIADAINDAQVHTLSYLRKVGVNIDDITVDTERELRRTLLSLTRYYFNSAVGGNVQEGSEILRNYEDAIEYLKAVSRGTLVLTTSKSRKSGFKILKIGVF